MINIESSSITPQIILEEGKMSFRGKSIPNNTAEIYAVVLDGLDEYLTASVTKHITLELDFSCLNTSSSKWLHEIFKKMASYYDKGYTFDSVWKFEHHDEDMKDLGQILSSSSGLDMRMEEVPEKIIRIEKRTSFF